MSSRLSPKQLYDACKDRQQEFEKLDSKALHEHIAKEIHFRPLFGADVKLAANSSASDEMILLGIKYRDLLEVLREFNDRKNRWIILARWLREEGVCEPEMFLPKEVKLKSLLRKVWKGSRRKDLLYVVQVESWLPYFRRLLDERNKLNERNIHRITEELEKLGFELSAIEVANEEKSALQATSSWLSSQGLVSMETFRNAYSLFSAAFSKLSPADVAATYGEEIKLLRHRGETSEPLDKALSDRMHRRKHHLKPSTKTAP
jgi:hypothetical protein